MPAAAALKVVDAPPPPALAPPIAAKIAATEGSLASLRQQVGGLVLDRETGKPGAAAALDKLNQRIDAEARNLDQMRAALETAEMRDAATTRAAVHALRTASLKDFEAALAVRTAAAQELSDAIARASDAYRRFLEAQQSLPSILPLGVALDESETRMLAEAPAHLIEREFWRVGAKVDAQGIAVARYAFPGARPHDLMRFNNPASLPTLVGEVAAGTSNILNKVRDRVAALA